MAATATFRVWRGDSQGGSFSDYKTEITEGMVVLDAIHQDPGRTGQRPGGPLELQGGQMRIVLGRDKRDAAADVHDAA